MSQMDQLATREQKCKTTFNQHDSLFIKNSIALFVALTRPMLQHILAQNWLSSVFWSKHKNMTEGVVQSESIILTLGSLGCRWWGTTPSRAVMSGPVPWGTRGCHTYSTTHQLQPTVLKTYNSSSPTLLLSSSAIFHMGHSSTNYPPMLIFQAGYPKEPNCHFDQYWDINYTR